MAVETNKTLSYTRVAYSLESVVIGAHIHTGADTQLRMEQSGFRADQQQAYKTAKGGWQKFVSGLVGVVGGLR
jgi:hypothetical protein